MFVIFIQYSVLIFLHFLSIPPSNRWYISWIIAFVKQFIPCESSFIFTYCVCLFCSRIGDIMMEFDATVIQVRGLASYKTRFNPPFSTFENACTKSGIWQLLSIRLMCLSFWFCHLIRDFPFWIFLGVQYFCDFTFSHH